MVIVSIHGNGATKASWNYIKDKVGSSLQWIDLEYDSEEGFVNNLGKMERKIVGLTDADEPIIFVAHSLGGVYAAYLARFTGELNVLGGITIATPFLGSEAAITLNMICPSLLYKEITPYSPVITGLKNIRLQGNWTGLVTVNGQSKLMSGANDGVVTYASMTGMNSIKYVKVAASHHECLLHDNVAVLINEKIVKLMEVV